MDLLPNVIMGFQVALQPINIFFCFIGVLIGTLVGVLPGLDMLALPPWLVACLLIAIPLVTALKKILRVW